MLIEDERGLACFSWRSAPSIKGWLEVASRLTTQAQRPCEMAAMRLILTAFMVAGAEAGACTPVDSCPKLSDGLYCPVNDVTEHADINRDVKLIKEYLAETPLNYAMAKQVYTEGSFSSKGLGNMRTLQDL